MLVDGTEIWGGELVWLGGVKTELVGMPAHPADWTADDDPYRFEISVDVGPVVVSHCADILKLRVTTTLDQQAEDESFASRMSRLKLVQVVVARRALLTRLYTRSAHARQDGRAIPATQPC